MKTFRPFILIILALAIIGCGDSSDTYVYYNVYDEPIDYETFYDSMNNDCDFWGTAGEKTHVLEDGDGYCEYDISNAWLDNNHPNFGDMILVSYSATGDIYAPSMHLEGYNLKNGWIRFWVKGNGFTADELAGVEFIFWVASQEDLEVENAVIDGHACWRRSNWGMTGVDMKEYLLDGAWHYVEIKLIPDERLWTWAHGNPAQYDGGERYNYKPPISHVLENVNVDILFVLTNVDGKAIDGSVAFDDFELKYRE